MEESKNKDMIMSATVDMVSYLGWRISRLVLSEFRVDRMI